MVSFSAYKTSLILLLSVCIAQVHCGKVFFPSAIKAPDTDSAEDTQENLEPRGAEPRGAFAQQSEDDQDDLESYAEGRGFWESDNYYLQKLAGLSRIFGGSEKPKRRILRPVRPEMLPLSLSNRRNGLQSPQLHNQIGGQHAPLRRPAAPANTLTAPRPYLDEQVQQIKALSHNFAVINVPPQPKPVQPTETIGNVAPAESFPYQFVRPDNTGASVNTGRPTKQQPSAPVFKRQPIQNTFGGKVPKPALLNGPDTFRKTAVVKNHLNNPAPNSILQIGSLNGQSSIPLPRPQQTVVPQTIVGQHSQTHNIRQQPIGGNVRQPIGGNVRQPIGGIMPHPTPPQPFQSFKISSSIGFGGNKQKPGTVQNVNFVKQAVPPKQSMVNSQIDPIFVKKPQFANKPAVSKKPAMSFLDNLASMAGSVTNVFNPKPAKTQHPRPAPNPQRVFHQPQHQPQPQPQPRPTQPTIPPFNPSLQFNPSPQEGNSLLSDAFQPVFIASPSLDEELDQDLMKPIYVNSFKRAPETDITSSDPELVDFF